LDYGEKQANSRSKAVGHFVNSLGYFLIGDMTLAIESGEKAIEVAEDPLYVQFGRTTAGMARLASGEFQKANEVLKPMIDFAQKGGSKFGLLWANIFLGPALIALGKMNQGMSLMDIASKMIEKSQRKGCEVFYEYVMGKTFAIMETGPKPSIGIMARNIGFIMKNVPTASKKALEHFNRAIELSNEIGMRGTLGLSYFDLGLFYKSKKHTEKAREALSNAIRVFKEIGAETNLKNAEEVLESLR